MLCDLKRKLDLNVVEVFRNGEKVYVLPKALSKGEARFKDLRSILVRRTRLRRATVSLTAPCWRRPDLGIVAPALAQNYSFQECGLSFREKIFLRSCACHLYWRVLKLYEK